MTVLRVKDLMTTDVETMAPGDTLAMAEVLMRLDRFHHLPVLEHGKVVGVISDRDVLRAEVEVAQDPKGDERRVKIAQIMTRSVITVAPEAPALEAAQTMRRNKISCLPVVSGDRLVGIVTETDFLDHLIHLLSTL